MMKLEHLFNKFISEDSKEYGYLIVDLMAGVSEFSEVSIGELRKQFDVIIPVLRPDLSHRPDLCPQIVQISSPGEIADIEYMSITEKYAKEERIRKRHYIVGWLSSHLEPQKISSHIASCCSSMGRSIRSGYSLPFFEPLRLELLYLTDNHSRGWLNHMLWPINHWGLITAGGEPKVISGNEKNNYGYFTEWGVSSQKNHNAISSLLAAWNKINRDKQQSLPLDATKQALEQIDLAISHGIYDLEKKILFGLNNLTK